MLHKYMRKEKRLICYYGAGNHNWLGNIRSFNFSFDCTTQVIEAPFYTS